MYCCSEIELSCDIFDYNKELALHWLEEKSDYIWGMVNSEISINCQKIDFGAFFP
jgi:hypothetical protein